jgi:hypothetical protein|tara:strand:+ start:142 stop:372 length:231 start_codon:yes stop_codon:yes gene_type:complete
MTTEDKIDELVDYNIENLADLLGVRADSLTSLQYTALDRIFRYDGITSFDKKSNALIDLEYKEMEETKLEYWRGLE